MSTPTPSKLRLWWGLIRPRTLPSALSSVVVAVSYAYSQMGQVSWLLVAGLATIAISAQIASNIANDLIDYRKGGDTEMRTGPVRPLSRGLLSEREVIVALSLSLLVLLLSGAYVICTTSWLLIAVGIAIVIGLFAYSGGPFPLSRKGLGEVAVVVFFGWVPVVTSYWVLGGSILDPALWALATSIGLASANILIVNNYRDYDEDLRVGKRTLIVRLGRDFAPRCYLSFGMVALLLLYPILLNSGVKLLLILPIAYLLMRNYRRLGLLKGAELNRVLADTALMVLAIAICIAILLLV